MENKFETFDDLKVLAVEDDAPARRLLQSMLREIGVHQLFMAKDGKEALEFLGDCDEMVNVIICDWNMPHVSGFEVLRQVRTADPDIPFMMLTGAADPESVSMARDNGVTSYLAKPFSQNDLIKKLRQILRILLVQQQTD